MSDKKAIASTIKSKFMRQFPLIAPLMAHVEIENGGNLPPFVAFGTDIEFIKIHLPEVCFNLTTIKDDIYEFGGDKRRLSISILHELLHVLFRHVTPPPSLEDNFDGQVWYNACEYVLQKYMLNKGIGQEFYKEVVASYEEIAPDLKDVSDPLTAYRILLKAKRKKADLFEGQVIYLVIVNSDGNVTGKNNAGHGNKIGIVKLDKQDNLKKHTCGGFQVIFSGKGNDKSSDISNKTKSIDLNGLARLINTIIAKLAGMGKGDILADISPVEQKDLPWFINLKVKVAQWLDTIRYNYEQPSEESLYSFRAIYPNPEGEVVRIGVAIDVSGSMGINEIKRGLAYVAKDYQIEVIVTHSDGIHEIFHDINDLRSAKIGGGTSYDEVIKFFDKNYPDLPVVWITDGVCDSNIPDYFPVFFVFTYPTPNKKYLRFNHIIV